MLTINVTTEQMRSMVRFSHIKLDDELAELKGAFLADLNITGVNYIPDGDKLSYATLRLYLRWQENYNGEAERYKLAYEAAKTAMSLASEYREVPTP